MELAANPAADSLPYALGISLPWNGRLAGGTELPSGLHALYIAGKDEDGNEFSYFISSFTIAAGPYVSIASPFAAPYAYFRGDSQTCPSSLNPAMISGQFAITMAANGIPLKQLEIKYPYGETVTLLPAAEEKENWTRSLDTFQEGRYEVTVVDERGNRTYAPFSVGILEAILEWDSAVSRYDPGSDRFSVTLPMKLQSGYPLKQAELYDEGGALLRTDAFTAKSADITYALSGLFGTDGFTRAYDAAPASRYFTENLGSRLL
ncbi:MAG: hypothetical protein M0011_12285 [Elusimicrobia bacterium]|nr:hypothetical protein [Elusimicrobiota bacterium]